MIKGDGRDADLVSQSHERGAMWNVFSSFTDDWKMLDDAPILRSSE